MIRTAVVCSIVLLSAFTSSGVVLGQTARIQLRKYNGTTHGQLIQEYSDGGNVVITNTMGLGDYLIRSYDPSHPNDPPTLSVGIVSVEINDPSSGAVSIRFSSDFTHSGVGEEGVVSCGGIIDFWAAAGIDTTVKLSSMLGDLTGDIDVDRIQMFYLQGDIDDDVSIIADDTMEDMNLYVRSIGGGVSIETFGVDGNAEIGSIRTGWFGQSTPNAHVMGAVNDPVIVRGESVQNIWSLGDMYLDVVAQGSIASVRTSWMGTPPNGLTQFDAAVNIVCDTLEELQVPFGDTAGSDEATVGGSIHITGTGGFVGVLRNLGSFEATMIIDYGLTGMSTFFVLDNSSSLKSQVIINAANDGGTWEDVTVDVGSESLEDGYSQTSSVIGGGAVGLAPFNFHATNCVPAHNSTVTSEPSTVTLSHYGPVEKHGDQGGLEIKIQRHPINISCANCEDVTDDFSWEYSSSERDIVITPDVGEAFEDGYEYHITPIRTGDTTLACVGVTGSPVVQSYNYHFTVDVP